MKEDGNNRHRPCLVPRQGRPYPRDSSAAWTLSAAKSLMQISFFAPRYWGVWLLVGVMRGAAKLPYVLQRGAGGLIGYLLYGLAGRRRRIAEKNLALCFPEKSRAERAHLLREHFDALGMAFVELGMTYWASEAVLRSRAKVSGLRHLRQALEKGKGVILLGSHFTTMELGLRFLLLYQEIRIMYRRNNNPLLDQIIHRGRSRLRGEMFPREDVRTLYRSLRENQVVWYAPDQNYGSKHSVFASFFGQPAATITTPARFAAKSGSPVLPLVQYRLPGNQGYEVVVGPALEDFPIGDDEQDARRVNEVVEEQIRVAPEQYLWVHRRFKTQPEGLPNVYVGV